MIKMKQKIAGNIIITTTALLGVCVGFTFKNYCHKKRNLDFCKKTIKKNDTYLRKYLLIHQTFQENLKNPIVPIYYHHVTEVEAEDNVEEMKNYPKYYRLEYGKSKKAV